MSYSRSLGQAKIVPGQISFATTETGRIPNVQRLIEAGLPIAPYIEHGSWETGQPDIMRYGRDPYRGLFGLGQTPSPASNLQQAGAQVIQDTIQRTAQQLGVTISVIGAGVVGGALGAVVASFLKRPVLSTMAGAVGGGVLAAVMWKANPATPTSPPSSP